MQERHKRYALTAVMLPLEESMTHRASGSMRMSLAVESRSRRLRTLLLACKIHGVSVCLRQPQPEPRHGGINVQPSS